MLYTCCVQYPQNDMYLQVIDAKAAMSKSSRGSGMAWDRDKALICMLMALVLGLREAIKQYEEGSHPIPVTFSSHARHFVAAEVVHSGCR